MKYGMSEEDDSALKAGQARFIAFGVGGGGGNAVEYMVNQRVQGVTFVCANTDRQALDMLTVPNKFQLGVQLTRGLGAGGDPEVGCAAAKEDEEEIKAILKDFDMVFITAGMGGGTGTGGAPVVARIAKELGKLTVAVVTTPFKFEGEKRAKAAKDGIEQLSAHVDSIITIPNQKLLEIYPKLSMRDAFKKADDVLLQGVNGLAKTIHSPGLINIDFNDIRTAMSAKGYAMMGIGRASGEDRARQAAEKAIRSPLLDDLRLENAQGLLVNIAASEVMMSEPDEIAEIVGSITDLDQGNIFYGVVEDESIGDDDIQVTIIATGLTLDTRPKVAPRQPVAQPATAAVTSTDQVAQPTSGVKPMGGTNNKLDVSSYLKSRG